MGEGKGRSLRGKAGRGKEGKGHEVTGDEDVNAGLWVMTVGL